MRENCCTTEDFKIYIRYLADDLAVEYPVLTDLVDACFKEFWKIHGGAIVTIDGIPIERDHSTDQFLLKEVIKEAVIEREPYSLEALATAVARCLNF